MEFSIKKNNVKRELTLQRTTRV